MKTIPFDDPETAIKIIEALADQTRRRILLYIQENPGGVTASKIAKNVNKRIPTVLHHLNIFDELDLIRSEMKSVGSDSGREVKHWFMKEEHLTIEIDFSSIAFIPEEDIIKYFEKMKSAGQSLAIGLLDENSENIGASELLAINPKLTDRQVEIIQKALNKSFKLYLQKWIDQVYDDSGRQLALNRTEFQNTFSLDNELADMMFGNTANLKDYYMSKVCECGYDIQDYRFCPNCGKQAEGELANRLRKKNT